MTLLCVANVSFKRSRPWNLSTSLRCSTELEGVWSFGSCRERKKVSSQWKLAHFGQERVVPVVHFSDHVHHVAQIDELVVLLF